MSLFPTWQIWQLIHERIEANQRVIWQRMLGIKPNPNPPSLLSNIWMWVIFSFVINVIASIGGRYLLTSSMRFATILSLLSMISFLMPLLVAWVSLRYALRLINAVMKQRECGTYDLFTLLPMGEFGNLLNIARTFRHPLQGRIIGGLSFDILFGLALIAALYAPLSTFGDSSPPRFDSIMSNPPSIMLRGVYSFVSYLQSFALALMLAILILQRAHRNEPRAWFIVGFLALQIGLFFVGGWLSGYMGRYLQTSTYQVIGIEIVFATLSPYLISQTVVLILLRELVNSVLWQALKRRLEA